MRIIGVVVLTAGILALAYGGFTYTRQTHDVALGPVQVSVSDQERVRMPVWVGVGLTVLGAGVLVSGRRLRPA